MLPGAVPVPIPPVRPGVPSQAVAPMPYGQVAYGYMAVPPLQALMGMPPPGMPQYSVPYPAMIRPGFPPHPIPPTGVIPQLPRPPIPGICGMPPVVTPLIRPVAPIAEPTEKPQTTVYVGKIAATVENEFLLSILKLCGPVKSWKRAQDPSDGTPKGFGFCEFESAEGVLRSLRLLSKLNIDGQVLVLNINEATRKYLEQYVEKKTEREKLKETETGDPEKEKDSKEAYVKPEPMKPVEEETKKDSEVSGDKENQEINKKFGIVTDEDHEADRDALEKLTNIIEERLKNKPLPAPLPVQIPVDGSAKSTSEVPSKSRNRDFNVDIMRNDAAEDKNDEETTNENKSVTENVVPETGSPGKARRHDSKSRGQDRERNLKRDKERELERAERERERKRVRWERERELKLREAEWLYKDRLKEWEAREREKEYRQRYEREWEKERERERQKEILQQEEESSDDDNDSRKRRRRSGIPEEKRRKRKQEKEEDLDDRLKEEEEIAEAKRKEVEEQQLKPDPKSLSRVTFEYGRPFVQEEVQFIEFKQNVSDQAYEASGNDLSNYGMSGNGNADDHNMAPIATSDTKQNNNAPAQKLEFSLIGSGKQMTVPSVFHEENDEDVDEKKMRPLVPIDYSTKELQAVQTNASGPQPNLTAADEFAKGISSVNPKEEKPDVHRERNRHFNEKLNLKERDQNDGESSCSKDESKERMHEMNVYREKDQEDGIKTENNKFLDAKQLINMIPKTKEELFVYEINWGIFDEHQLHAKMRPWISKKTTEFLGEEEATLVDYIVSCIKDHIQASTMLEMLQSILDDEAEMFVLKMWRMLIFEIKRVETGFSVIPRS